MNRRTEEVDWRKYMKNLMIILLISIFLTGCVNDSFNQAIDQANAALQKGNADQALSSLELAIDEDPKNPEVKQSYRNLEMFIQLKSDMDNEKWKSALKTAEALLKQKDLNPYIKKETKQYIEQANNKVQQELEMKSKIDIISNLIEEKKYNEAEQAMNKLLADERLGNNQKLLEDEIKNLKNLIDIKSEQYAKKQEQNSKKSEYILKMSQIEKEVAKLNNKKASTTVEMEKVAADSYKMWDDTLNEIYGVLKQQLSSNVMSDVREQQLDWITNRDNKAKKDASSYQGGTLYEVEFLNSLTKTTKERCYELVEIYMK